MKAVDIINIMNRWAPQYLIDSWDNTGFQIGDPQKEIKKVLVSLDLDKSALKKAKDENVDMIITHHPIIFETLDKITTNNYKGELIYNIVKKDIVVYNAHTNLDVAIGGVNDVLARLLELEDIEVLSKSYEEKLYKVVVFVPNTHSEILRKTLGNVGAGWIGNYSHCTYNVEGVGTFIPRKGTNPYIGSIDKLERVNETRIETIVKEKDLDKTIDEMLKVHPYEEVAYDIYELRNTGIEYGYGRVGNIGEIPLSKFLDKVKDALEINQLIVYGNLDIRINRVALCGGSGGDFIQDAYMKGADVYLTGDIKYHEAQLANELGIILIDVNHFDTEKVILPVIKERLEKETGGEIRILLHEKSAAPFKIY